ncbi:MAG: hypothetical protein FWD52_02755 [Candidatus Bathyarchaeota archaeon]|nr:hypothetical protein [Candidatus Termiticorpusculum sp.]
MGKFFQKVVAMFLLMVLFLGVVCALTVPGVCAVESSVSEKGLGVLRDFFGLDLSQYDVVFEEDCLSESFLGDVFETVLFTLTSEGSKLRLVFTFVGGNLLNVYVFENDGVPLLNFGVADGDVVGGAQSFLGRYGQYLSWSFFGDLKSSLDGVGVNKNCTKPVGNALLEVTVYDDVDVTNFMWYLADVGGVEDLCVGVVALGFKDGAFVSFTNTWTLYGGVDKSFVLLKTGNTAEVLSVVDNVDGVGLSVKSLGSMVLFSGVDCLVVVVLFVVVIGGVFGVGLFFGGLRGLCFFKRFFVKKVFGLLFVWLLLFLVVFLPLVGAVSALPVGGVVWGSRSSGALNDLYGSHSWRKTDAEIGLQDFVGRFLVSNCLTVANGYVGFSNLWANKSSVLSQAQGLNVNYDHVAVFDWDHGVGGYPGAVSFSYDGVPADELHYMFEDDWGTIVGGPSDYETDWSHGVYDIDIYEAFSAGKVHFAFINTCLSANTELFGQGTSPSGYPLGMPFAFTHRMVGYVPLGSNSTLMSDDGYNRPDAFPQCYIGFPFGSASLDQYISYNENWQPWYKWVVYFCYMAFNFDVSVNEALDWACSMQWGCPSFGVSPLQGDGFTAIWPIWDDENKEFTVSRVQGLHSTLAVYGNGNIHLKNFQAPHMVSYPYVSGPKSVDPEVLVDFSVYSVDPFNHDVRYVFDWGDNTPQTTTNYAKAGVPVTVSHLWSTAGVYEVVVKAQCEDGTWSDWSESHIITVGSSYWLTITVISIFLIGFILLVLILWYRFKRQ